MKINIENKKSKQNTKNETYKIEHRWCLAKLQTAEQQFMMAWESQSIPECFEPALQHWYILVLISQVEIEGVSATICWLGYLIVCMRWSQVRFHLGVRT